MKFSKGYPQGAIMLSKSSQQWHTSGALCHVQVHRKLNKLESWFWVIFHCMLQRAGVPLIWGWSLIGCGSAERLWASHLIYTNNSPAEYGDCVSIHRAPSEDVKEKHNHVTDCNDMGGNSGSKFDYLKTAWLNMWQQQWVNGNQQACFSRLLCNSFKWHWGYFPEVQDLLTPQQSLILLEMINIPQSTTESKCQIHQTV